MKIGKVYRRTFKDRPWLPTGVIARYYSIIKVPTGFRTIRGAILLAHRKEGEEIDYLDRVVLTSQPATFIKIKPKK